VTSIEEMSSNRLWAAPKLPRLSFNHLAVSGCIASVRQPDQLGRWKAVVNGSYRPGAVDRFDSAPGDVLELP